jgi:phosphoglycolate phosphatase
MQMNNNHKTIIFDLDGTLIDSSDSILDSFKSAFLSCNVEPIKTLNSDIIGPPLMEILALLSGSSDQTILNNLATQFKLYYDSSGFKKTIVFPGVHKMLSDLNNAGLRLYIATNKRIYPTKKIIDILKWNNLFEGIYALDSVFSHAASKGQLLNKIIENNNLIKENVIYIGDREDDRIASIFSNLDFLLVTWGYEENKEIFHDIEKIDTPHELFIKLLENN